MEMDERFLLTWAFGMWTVHAGYMNMFAEQNVHSYVQDESPRYNYIYVDVEHKANRCMFIF